MGSVNPNELTSQLTQGVGDIEQSINAISAADAGATTADAAITAAQAKVDSAQQNLTDAEAAAATAHQGMGDARAAAVVSIDSLISTLEGFKSQLAPPADPPVDPPTEEQPTIDPNTGLPV